RKERKASAGYSGCQTQSKLNLKIKRQRKLPFLISKSTERAKKAKSKAICVTQLFVFFDALEKAAQVAFFYWLFPVSKRTLEGIIKKMNWERK
ncbi:MAG TPA: hypothetical protein PKW50_02150, partial [Syntrophomonas sp.]|nr:hypothetical protein [Syntrophomonas sp.]